MSTRILFDYWTDPLCIWAFVAQPRLERLLAEQGDLLDVRYRVVPVFGSVSWRFQRGPWASDGVDGRARKTREVAEQFGVEGVSGEVWRADAPASSWSPGAAVKAVFALAEQGEITPGCAISYQWRLREAFFLEDRNVARRSVQLEVAEACDVPPSALERALDDGTALAALWEDHRDREVQGIQGSPTYVFDGGRAMLYGNVAEEIIRATVDALRRGLEPGKSAC